MLDDKSQTTTREGRRAVGRSCRNQVKRVDQGSWSPKARQHDVLDLLLAAQHGRVPSLLPIKWARMAASPFGFFRGAVPVMAAIHGYLGNSDKFDKSMAGYGVTYANQTVKDWEQLRRAIRSGKLRAAKSRSPSKKAAKQS